MAETQWLEVLRPIFELWQNRNERNAAQDAGGLIFWRDGMLRQIEAIANGAMTDDILQDLRSGLENTQQSTDNAIQRLKYTRAKLAGTRIADQIDKVLNHEAWGKASTREKIARLLDSVQRTREEGEGLRRRIATLNAEIQRLHRMVDERSAQ